MNVEIAVLDHAIRTKHSDLYSNFESNLMKHYAVYDEQRLSAQINEIIP